jgi:hypothetical protein
MSKMRGLQQALKDTSGKASVQRPEPVKVVASTNGRSPSREGKEFTGAWLKADFGTSLRLVQIRKRKDEKGCKVYLDDLLAEALNDLFRKYDVPTVSHE